MMPLPPPDQAYKWLEQVEAPEALAWVTAQNQRTLARLQQDPEFNQRHSAALAILEAKDKIAAGTIRGAKVYNFWQDKGHVKGLWRQSSYEAYVAGRPVWDELLDVDFLAKAEGKNYVLKRLSCYERQPRYCLVSLSEGGSDAASMREFDVETKSFVAGGFATTASKSDGQWLDHDRVLLADATAGAPLTDSGYPMSVRLWRRGESLQQAPVIFHGQKTDVAVRASTYRDGPRDYVLIERADTFFTAEQWLYQDGKTTRLPLPTDVSVHDVFHGQLLFSNRSALSGFAPGSLLAAAMEPLSKGQLVLRQIFAPGPGQSLDQVSTGKDFVYVGLLDQVRSRLCRYRLQGDEWQLEAVPLPDSGQIQLQSVDRESNRLLVSYEDFLTPTSLYSFASDLSQKRLVQQLPPRFAAADLTIVQAFATSSDGTKVPYFRIQRHDLPANGQNPTLLYGYGGFEISLRPSYLTVAGKLWLEAGGVYVLANIRGGGEYGPQWHQAALKAHRQRAFDDFAAVAKALINDQITSPRHLGIQGGSNGGLLMGASFTQHPELFNAVVCQVPLLDMLRYHKLLAGASWMAEYGDPEVAAEAAYIRRYSPFHNIPPAGTALPEIFFMTSTKDDRVHPGHARKMAARLADMQHAFLYYEKIDGGHSVSTDLQQMAAMAALTYTYLWQKLH